MKYPLSGVFVVRFHLWWLWLRLSLGLQTLFLAIAFIVICCRAATRHTLYERGDEEWLLAGTVVAACLAAVISVPYWWNRRWFLSVEGIHRGRSFSAKSMFPFIYWGSVTLVQRRHGWLSGRWLCVVSEYGEVIKLPEHPADPAGFREAVDQLAGELHPLARALAEVAEAG